MTRLRKLGIAFLVFCVLAIGLFALQSKIFPLGMRWLDIGETPVKADAVFVLLGEYGHAAIRCGRTLPCRACF